MTQTPQPPLSPLDYVVEMLDVWEAVAAGLRDYIDTVKTERGNRERR